MNGSFEVVGRASLTKLTEIFLELPNMVSTLIKFMVAQK